MKRPWLRRVLWPITLLLLAYLFYTTPIAQIVRSFSAAAWWTIPAVGLLVVVVFLADSFAIWRIFSWFTVPLSLRETLIVRGASYPLALVNYALGQGAFAYFLHARRGVALGRSAATVLLVMGTNLLLLLLVATAALAFVSAGDIPAALAPHLRLIRMLIVVGFSGLALYIALIAVRPRVLLNRPAFEVLFAAGLRGHLWALLVRLPHLGALILFALLYLRAFGVAVPVQQALLFLPVAFLVAAVPLPGQGLGIAQILMREIFSPYAAGDMETRRATVVAASLAGQLIAMVVQLVVGLVCLRDQLAAHLRSRSALLHPPASSAQPTSSEVK